MSTPMERVSDEDVALVRRRLRRAGHVVRDSGFDCWMRSNVPLTFNIGDELHINEGPYQAVYAYEDVGGTGTTRAVVYVDGTTMYALEDAA